MTRKPQPPRFKKRIPLREALPMWVEVLRERVPPRHEVRVIRRRLKLHAGTCELQTKPQRVFYVFIDDRMSRSETRETLIHEWAHALSWFDRMPEAEPHGAAWGRAYYKTYQALVDL